MFGEGVLGFSQVFLCICTCVMMPAILWTAFSISIMFPKLRGVLFGLAFAFPAYVFFGVLFGDLFGVAAGILVFLSVMSNRRQIRVSRQRIETNFFRIDTDNPFSNPFDNQSTNPRASQSKDEPYMTIIDPSEDE